MVLPSWVQSDEDKPAPMPLLRVQAFVNTRDIDEETDLLLDAERATQWLRQAELVGPDTTVSPSDLELARTVRESIRVLLGANSGGPAPSADDLAPIQALTATCPARLGVDPTGRLHLGTAAPTTVAEGLVDLLLVVRDAQRDGTWARLKTCGNPDCAWVFYDRSHSRRGVWCDMAACGNIMKNRSLRARRR
jgi:predicted RNA-binding Zn ribbon-like protein